MKKEVNINPAKKARVVLPSLPILFIEIEE
jgi:hypothetical protein